jgi:hypothetical protein
MPLEEMFWGDRRYEALDLEGHRWHFAERMTRAPDRRGELPGWRAFEARHPRHPRRALARRAIRIPAPHGLPGIRVQ